MSKLQGYLDEKEQLAKRLDAVEGFLIKMNVGVESTICIRDTIRFIGYTREIHHKLTHEQRRTFREFLNEERIAVNTRLNEIEEQLSKTESVL